MGLRREPNLRKEQIVSDTFKPGPREGTEAYRVQQEVEKRKKIAEERGIKDLMFELYFNKLKYFPNWIKSSRDYVPKVVESARSGKEDEKEILTLLFGGKTYRLEFSTRRFSTPDSDCESGLLELFTGQKKVFGIKTIRTLRMWGVEPEMAEAMADGKWGVTDISAFIDGDWVDDFEHLQEAIQEDNRLREIRRAEDPENTKRLRNGFGIE